MWIPAEKRWRQTWVDDSGAYLAFTGGMALVRNRQWDYLAANTVGRAVYAEVFDGRTGPPNHARYVFLDDRARAFFDDWPAVAHDTARILRSEAGRDPQTLEAAIYLTLAVDDNAKTAEQRIDNFLSAYYGQRPDMLDRTGPESAIVPPVSGL